MAEFAYLLETHAERRTVKEMAAQMGIDASMISQFTNGTKVSCRPETLMKMVSGISSEEHIQANLLAAYFRDQCTERYKPWISVDPEQPYRSMVREETELSGEQEQSAHPAPLHRKRVIHPEDPIGDLVTTLRELKIAPDIVRALQAIARGIPGHHKFRVVVEDLGKFATEELAPKPPKDSGK